MIAANTIYRNLPFVYFLGALGLFYIGSVHYAERNMRKLESMQEDLKQVRWKYMSLHSEVTRDGSRSRIADAVAGSGIAVPRVAPQKLIVHAKPGDNE